MGSNHKGTSLFTNRKIQKDGTRYSNKHNQRNNGSTTDTNNHRDHHRDSVSFVRWYTRIQSTLVKYFKKITIPFTAVSSTFLMTGFSKVKAETTDEGFVSKFIERGKVENNPYADTGFASDVFGLSPDKLQELFNGLLVNSINKSTMVESSIKTLAYIYNLIVHVIITTPAIVFDSHWFSNSYMKFAGVSVLAFTLMALFNAGRKTFNLSHTKFSDVIKRYFLAITGIGFATFFFQQFFKLIKFISEVIVSVGYHQITSSDFTVVSALTMGDGISLLLFNLVLAGLAVTIFLQNMRRWFQLACIGLTTSFTLSAWVFDSTRHIFTETKQKFVKLSLTQIYHAVMISIMGMFIVGTSGVENVTDLIIKLGMVAGGFTVMAKPPEFMGRFIDKNTEDITDMYKTLKRVVSYKINPAYTYSKMGIGKASELNQKRKDALKAARLAAGKRFLK